MSENYRTRVFLAVLYPEDESHLSAVYNLLANYDCAVVLHDKDVDEDGVLKKPHYHCVIKFKNAKWLYALSEELGVSDNYFEKCDNYDKAMRYLIHYDNKDKFQYDVSDVQGNLSESLQSIIDKVEKSESEILHELLNYIDESNHVYFCDFARYCASNGLWSYYRRSGAILNRIIEEHNFLIAERNN